MLGLADNLWLFPFPLKLVGCQLGRNVTVVRLSSGQLVIHSTAPFSRDDVAAITALGEPGWLVEATLFHDTCAAAGRAAFPDVPYLSPPGLDADLSTTPLLPPPPEWEGELEVVPLGGMPKVREHVLFHRPSATLIVADLVFNLAPTGWTRFFLRVASGLKTYPGMSRFFRFMIKDREAFCASLEIVRAFPFERIVVAHGDPIEENAREAFETALSPHGF